MQALTLFHRHPWKGDVVFVVHKELKQGHLTRFRDIDSIDFRDVVDFLSVCIGHRSRDNECFCKRAKKLSIVNMYTIRKPFGADIRVIDRVVPQDHRVIPDEGVKNDWGTMLQISRYIEIPMYAVRLPHPSEQLRRDSQPGILPWEFLVLRYLISPRTNGVPIAAIGPVRPSVSNIPSMTSATIELWEAGYGNLNSISVVLIREDGMDLRARDIDALILWITEIIFPRIERTSSDRLSDADHPIYWTADTYAQLFTKKGYHEYWHKQEAIELGVSSALPCGAIIKGRNRLPCPYNMTLECTRKAERSA
jgi:hypothetical protein